MAPSSAGVVSGGKGGLPPVGDGSDVSPVCGGSNKQAKCTKEVVIHTLKTVVHNVLHHVLQQRPIKLHV